MFRRNHRNGATTLTSLPHKPKLDVFRFRYLRAMPDSSIPTSRTPRTDLYAPGHDRLEKLLAIASLGEQTRGRRQAEQSLNEVRAHLNTLLGLYERLGSVQTVDLAAAIVCRDAFELTSAGAAAIALEEGEQMICRAAAGSPAPEVGVMVDIRGGLSGECIRSCASQRCDDTETDTRVNAVACRELGIRSIAMVPLHRNGRAFGLLEVFSPRAEAFNDDDISALQLMAVLLATEISRLQNVKSSDVSKSFEETDDTNQSEQIASDDTSSDMADLALPSLGAYGAPRTPNVLQNFLLKHRKPLIAVGLLVVAFALSWTAISSLRARVNRAAVSPPPKPVQVPAAVASVGDLKVAADRGDAQAQFALGVKYASGNDFPHDDAEAAKWMMLSAEQGYQEAQTMLSLFYSAGRGVPKDLVQAYKWSSIAAARGDNAGVGQIRFLKTIMQPQEIAAADRAANEWLMDRQPLPTQKAASKQ